MCYINYATSTKKKSKKDKAMTGHLKKRFKERFGFDLTNNILEYMIAQIKKQKSTFVGKQSCSRSIHIVNVPKDSETVQVVVIYNINKHLIHTCFPISWLENKEYEQYIERQAYINGL